MTHPSHTSRQHRGPGIRGRSFRGRSIRGLGIRGRGITLIEMMVALAITTFVVLVVNQLFNGVIQTVGRGTQAGEILQRSRAFDEQIATETELIISGGRDASNPYDWFGRMVGPAGREVGQPGGFLVVVQRLIETPITLEDQLQDRRHLVRSDQLMFIYDQTPLFDQTGKKRLPPLAPTNSGSFGGDMGNSLNADYVRIWYGHAAQLNDQGIYAGDVGEYAVAGNPNAIAQDWVLGRHALFLTDSSTMLSARPIGAHTGSILPAFITANVLYGPSGASMFNACTDVADTTLNDIINGPGGLNAMPSPIGYQGIALSMAFASRPLWTTAKPVTPTTGQLSAWNLAPSHTYFMGGVSDFIVEFAGDLVTGTGYATPGVAPNPDGELDRDDEGRIKWYSAFPNPDWAPATAGPQFPDAPVSYPIPNGGAGYLPRASNATLNAFFGTRLDVGRAAFVWQHEPAGNIRSSDTDGDFRQWPWMLRIRYRLHDRRGQFEGREITVNPATGETVPEAGAWFETIIPVNSQGVK